MSYATLTKSNCESRVGDANQPVERHIPTYLETVRSVYSSELNERTYMYTDDELGEAHKYLESLVEQTDDPEAVKALYTARACIKEELRRRYRS